ncbi:MAG: methyltransferase domain-containing protein [Candidatus Zapsychrus exili]|nr:methyltransferase domain-containing protein [Candidatus Zapsychrus exili]
MSHKKIQDSFSFASGQYESLTQFHKEVGLGLIKKIEELDGDINILDVGMGTGWITERLADTFKRSNIIGVDSSFGMVNVAKKTNKSFAIVQADAKELPFKDEFFDIIVSNLAYQWVDDLTKAFSSCYTQLKPNGKIVLSMFGKNTFDELFVSLKRSHRDKSDISIDRLIEDTKVSDALLRAGFSNVEVKSQTFKLKFDDMMSLLKWIKGIGANLLNHNFYVGKDLLKRTGQYYEDNFKHEKSVYATLEVIWAEAKKLSL